MQDPRSALSAIVPLVIVFVVLLLRMRRMAGTRPLRLQSLWIRPAIVVMLAGLVIYSAPPHTINQGLILVAVLGIGAVLGWHQAKLMAITVDSATGTLQVKASFWAMAAFVALILLRVGLRPWLTGSTSPVHAYVGVVTDAFLLFYAGFVSAQSAEMFLRGRALLSAA